MSKNRIWGCDMNGKWGSSCDRSRVWHSGCGTLNEQENREHCNRLGQYKRISILF